MPVNQKIHSSKFVNLKTVKSASEKIRSTVFISLTVETGNQTKSELKTFSSLIITASPSFRREKKTKKQWPRDTKKKNQQRNKQWPRDTDLPFDASKTCRKLTCTRIYHRCIYQSTEFLRLTFCYLAKCKFRLIYQIKKKSTVALFGTICFCYLFTYYSFAAWRQSHIFQEYYVYTCT